MQTVFSSNDAVIAAWAAQSQREGRNANGSIFFDGTHLYGYGYHFCVARMLPSGVAAVTTRSFSMTTSRHTSGAKQAAGSYVVCHNPEANAADNLQQARTEIAGLLRLADAPRIKQVSRDRFLQRADAVAHRANAYLAALPAAEREGVKPIAAEMPEAA